MSIFKLTSSKLKALSKKAFIVISLTFKTISINVSATSSFFKIILISKDLRRSIKIAEEKV